MALASLTAQYVVFDRATGIEQSDAGFPQALEQRVDLVVLGRDGHCDRLVDQLEEARRVVSTVCVNALTDFRHRRAMNSACFDLVEQPFDDRLVFIAVTLIRRIYRQLTAFHKYSR